MMNIAERKQATAPADAQRWLESFEAALQAQDTAAAAELFLPDGLWRDVLAFTWTIQTLSGRPAIDAMLRETLARTKPGHFHFPAKRTSPRWLARAGTEAIEALFEFETAFGPGAGVVRLVPDASSRLRAWTIVTTLEELKGHEEKFRSRAAQANDGIRDFGAENWSDRLARARTYADHDPTVIVVGGGQGGLSIAARLHQLGIDTLIVDRHRTRRRQLAHAVSLTDIAQRSPCQSPALSAVPADISRLHSEGQAGELVRILRRGDGAEFLDGQRACRRTL